jgi:hypothetical protein
MLAATRRALHAAASAAATRAVVPFAVSMPDAVDAKIVSWLKRAGDPVKAGEAMCQIETRVSSSGAQLCPWSAERFSFCDVVLHALLLRLAPPVASSWAAAVR